MKPLEISIVEVDELGARTEVYHLKVPMTKEGLELGHKFLDIIPFNPKEGPTK